MLSVQQTEMPTPSLMSRLLRRQLPTQEDGHLASGCSKLRVKDKHAKNILLKAALLAGTSGSGQQAHGSASLGLPSQAVATAGTAEPPAPSAMALMAKSPDPFAALHNAERHSVPGPMFSGLNAIVNPFSTSRPSSPAARGAKAVANGKPVQTITDPSMSVAPSPGDILVATSAQPVLAARSSATNNRAAITAILAAPTAVAAQPPPSSTSATAAVSGAPAVQVSGSSEPAKAGQNSTETSSHPSTTAAAQATQAAPTGGAGLPTPPAAGVADAAAPPATATTAPATPAAAPTAAVGTGGAENATARMQANHIRTAVTISDVARSSSDIPAAPPQSQAAAANPVRNGSKRKWDAMTRPETAAPSAAASPAITATPSSAVATAPVTVAAAAAAAANSSVTLSGPAPSSRLSPTTVQAVGPQAGHASVTGLLDAGQANTAPTHSAAARSSVATSSSQTALPPSSQAAVAASSQLPLISQTGPAQGQLGTDLGTLPIPASGQVSTVPGTVPIPAPPTVLPEKPLSQSIRVSEATHLQPASKALEAGKEMAAALAAGFAAQHQSGLSLAPKTTVASVGHSTAAAPIDLSDAVKMAAAAAAEKIIKDKAVKARAAAEKLTHEQALKAFHSVQSGRDTHAARMEAIRLRNLARHDVPESTSLPPPPAQQNEATAVVAAHPSQPATQAAATSDLSQDSHRSSSQGKSRTGRKRSRELNQGVSWEAEPVPDLPGAPVEFVARGTASRLRTDSPASGGSRDSVSRQAHSPGKRQVTHGSPLLFVPALLHALCIPLALLQLLSFPPFLAPSFPHIDTYSSSARSYSKALEGGGGGYHMSTWVLSVLLCFSFLLMCRHVKGKVPA